MSLIIKNVPKIRNFSLVKRNFTVGKIVSNKQQVGATSSLSGNVPGLSNNCVKVPNEPVGPGAAKSTNYKNPEYFCYDKNSYFEAEVEMLKFRCPQPSAKEYFQQKK